MFNVPNGVTSHVKRLRYALDVFVSWKPDIDKMQAKTTQKVFQQATFCNAKGRKTHGERPCFRAQKAAFWKATDYQNLQARMRRHA